MIDRFKIVALGMFCALSASAVEADTKELVGSWQGPKDLLINICEDNQRQVYVCLCEIFRTYGWINFSTFVTADSLIMTSTDFGSPFEGRFRIVSDDRLEGTLAIGSADDSWYYRGNAELIKRKPPMPDNLNPELEGTILPADYDVLSLAREKAQEVLSTVTPTSIGYAEKKEVNDLLNAKAYPITPAEMIGFNRVRSIQIDARDGIFSYPFFDCRFREIDGKVFFEKTRGSQRKSGFLYSNDSESLIFLGGWSVNDESQTTYGSENSIAGTVYKIGPRRAIMIFPTDQNRVEIYELTK